MARNILTFVIPLLHPANAKDWASVKAGLAETARSIAAQDAPGWKAVIAANTGADLPALPAGFEVAWVDFPPNEFAGVATAKDEATRLDLRNRAVRADKGRRILAGLLHAGEMGHVMVVDDDDFVSRRLTSFVAANAQANGWYVRDGYIWTDGGKLLLEYNDFSHLCGTSHIIRSDLYQIPQRFEDASQDYVDYWLGSHMYFREHLDATGHGLTALPFPGAVYRTGHVVSVSRSQGIIRRYVLRRSLLKRPKELWGNVLRLRWKTKAMEAEFFGVGG